MMNVDEHLILSIYLIIRSVDSIQLPKACPFSLLTRLFLINKICSSIKHCISIQQRKTQGAALAWDEDILPTVQTI